MSEAAAFITGMKVPALQFVVWRYLPLAGYPTLLFPQRK
jgi:hypothetical protein